MTATIVMMSAVSVQESIPIFSSIRVFCQHLSEIESSRKFMTKRIIKRRTRRIFQIKGAYSCTELCRTTKNVKPSFRESYPVPDCSCPLALRFSRVHLVFLGVFFVIVHSFCVFADLYFSELRFCEFVVCLFRAKNVSCNCVCVLLSNLCVCCV